MSAGSLECLHELVEGLSRFKIYDVIYNIYLNVVEFI